MNENHFFKMNFTFFMKTYSPLIFLYLLSIILCVYGRCPDRYRPCKNDECCFHVIYYESKPLTFREAKEICKSYSNGTLASVDDERQEKFITDSFPSVTHFISWIGLERNLHNPDEFNWVDGNNSTYRNWKHGESKMVSDNGANCVKLEMKVVKEEKQINWDVEHCDSLLQVNGLVCRTSFNNVSDDEKKFFADLRSGAIQTGLLVGAVIIVISLLGIVGYKISSSYNVRKVNRRLLDDSPPKKDIQSADD